MGSNNDQAIDSAVQQILGAVQPYKELHPAAEIEARRHDSASIGVRIVDPDFSGIDRLEREDRVWPLLDKLPEDVQSELSMLVLVTPSEKFTSVASTTFQEIYMRTSNDAPK